MFILHAKFQVTQGTEETWAKSIFILKGMIKEKDQELKRVSTAPLWQEYYIYLNENIIQFLNSLLSPDLNFPSTNFIY